MTADSIAFLPNCKHPEPSSFDSAELWRRAAVESASASMDNFIAQVRKQSWFLLQDDGPKWDDLKWRLDRNRKLGHKLCYFFTTRPNSDEPLPQPFAEQARGIVAQTLLWKSGSTPETIRALRLIYHAMSATGQVPDLIHLHQHAIDMADATIHEQISRGSRYKVGKQLEIIVNNILFDMRLTVYPVCYYSQFKPVRGSNSSSHILRSELTEKEKNEAEPSKLPDFQAVFGLANLFHEPGNRFRNQNLIVSAFSALALFAPSRISEILCLPVDCKTYVEDNGRRNLGLKWKPAKGGEPMIKYAVTSEWENLTEESIRRLEVLGKTARTAAAWYESNPNRLYLPPGMEHMRGKPLTLQEVAMIIGYEPKNRPGFLTAHSMLNSLEHVNAGHKGCELSYSQKSVKNFVSDYINDYPCYPTDRLVQVKEWLERENSDLVIDGNLQVEAGNPMTAAQALSIIELSESDLEDPTSLHWLARNLKLTDAMADCNKRNDSKNQGQHLYEFASLESWVLSSLPKRMPTVDPQTDLKYSQALFCLPKFILNPKAPTYWNIPLWVSPNCIQGKLSGCGNQASIFALNGIIDSKTGEPPKMKSHSFRHLLNTLAQKAYLSQQLIAFWSGRRDVRQNPAYFGLNQEFFVRLYQSLTEDCADNVKVLETMHDTAVKISQEVVTFEQAKLMELGPVQLSMFGICKHNLAVTPCPFEIDCLNCAENMFVAHDPDMINRVKEQIELHQNSLDKSNKDAQLNLQNADKWTRMHANKLVRLRKALELMTDQKTPPGETVSLPANPRAKTTVELAMDLHDYNDAKKTTDNHGEDK